MLRSEQLAGLVAHCHTHGESCPLPPEVMHTALRRRLRLLLPLRPRRAWLPEAVGRTGERNWSSAPGLQFVARQWGGGGGAEGHVVRQQAVGVAHVSARRADVRPRRLDLVVYGVSPRASHCVAMRRWIAPSPVRAPRIHAQTTLQACNIIRSCNAGRRPASPRPGCGGRALLEQALVRQHIRVRAFRRRRRFELPLPPLSPGRGGGGACYRLRCSMPLAARPWQRRGSSPTAPRALSLLWTTLQRSRSP